MMPARKYLEAPTPSRSHLITLRLYPEELAMLNRLVRATGLDASKILRKALQRYADTVE